MGGTGRGSEGTGSTSGVAEGCVAAQPIIQPQFSFDPGERFLLEFRQAFNNKCSMSKKTQDMSKVRKKLEQSSKKTRRSSDLRRSLGRKSVGDVSDLGSLEQASFSNCTLDESCHLNTDSAIINPSVLGRN